MSASDKKKSKRDKEEEGFEPSVTFGYINGYLKLHGFPKRLGFKTVHETFIAYGSSLFLPSELSIPL